MTKRGRGLRLSEFPPQWTGAAKQAIARATVRPAKPAKPLPTESAEQQAVIAWWESYCKTRNLHECLLFSVPNGSVLAGDAKHRAIQMARLKREGLRAGCPDLFLAVPKFHRVGAVITGTIIFCGMALEMKRADGGNLTIEQSEFHFSLRDKGYNCVVCWGADEAIKAIRAYIET